MKRRIAAVAILFVIALFYGLCYFLSPLQIEDYVFRFAYLDCNGGDSGFSLRSLWDYRNLIAAHDNARLANVMAPFSSLFQPWKYLFPWLTGAAVAAIVWLATRLATGKIQNGPEIASKAAASRQNSVVYALSIVWLAVMTLLPWRNELFVADFALNYVWGALINLGFAAVVLSYARSGRGFWAVAILALISALWHEGFCLPVLAGLLAATFVTPLRHDTRWWITGFFCLALCIANFITPGMLARLHAEAGAGGGGHILRDYLPVAIAIAIILALCCFRAGRQLMRKLYKDPVFLTFAVAGICGCIFSLTVSHSPRMAFFPTLCGIIVIMRVAAAAMTEKPGWMKIFRAAGIVAGICALVLSGIVLKWQWHFHTQYREIERQMEQSGNGTVFYDLTMPEEVPGVAMGYPSSALYTVYFNYWAKMQEAGGRMLAVVPTALRDASPSTSEALGGGVYRAGEALYMTPDGMERVSVDDETYVHRADMFETTLQNGREYMVPGMALPYVNARGERLVYIMLYKLKAADVRKVVPHPNPKYFGE